MYFFLIQGPSDSESLSDSSISGAEETHNEAEENHHDDLTSSSPPTSPSPVESDKEKTAVVPIPIESTISGEQLAELPRPEPQHPSPSLQPIISSPLNPPQLPIGSPLLTTSVPPSSSHIPQGFVPLPPLPAFVFRPQFQTQSEPLYPNPPPTVTASEKSHSPSLSDSEPKTVNSVTPVTSTIAPPSVGSYPEVRETTVISLPKVKEEVITPPQSPKKVSIKQEPRDSVDFMSNNDRNVASANVASAKSVDSFSVKDVMCPLVTPKLEPGTLYSSAATFTSSSSSSSSNQGQVDMTLTSQAQVKGHGESEGEKSERSLEGDKSEPDVWEEDSEPEMCGTPPPEPEPTPCNVEIHRTASAM